MCVCLCACECVCARAEFNCKLLKVSPYSAIEPNNSHRQSINSKLTGNIDVTLDEPFTNCTHSFLENSDDLLDTRVLESVNQLNCCYCALVEG